MLPDDSYPVDVSIILPPCSSSHLREEGRIEWLLSFEDVQERLVEAVLTSWRLPDRESGWQRVKACWPDVLRHTWFGDYGDMESDAPIRSAALTRADVARMEEAFGWLRHVPERDRRLVGLALRQLAKGRGQVPWAELLGPMGLRRGADGLRKRYGRALTAICKRLNAAL